MKGTLKRTEWLENCAAHSMMCGVETRIVGRRARGIRERSIVSEEPMMQIEGQAI
jgi:hypothetical protein